MCQAYVRDSLLFKVGPTPGGGVPPPFVGKKNLTPIFGVPRGMPPTPPPLGGSLPDSWVAPDFEKKLDQRIIIPQKRHEIEWICHLLGASQQVARPKGSPQGEFVRTEVRLILCSNLLRPLEERRWIISSGGFAFVWDLTFSASARASWLVFTHVFLGGGGYPG